MVMQYVSFYFILNIFVITLESLGELSSFCL